MKDTAQELLKSTMTVVILLGAALLLVSAANGITVGTTFSLQIADPGWRIVLAGVGVVFIALGLYQFVRSSIPERVSTREGDPILPKTGETADYHILRHELRSEIGLHPPAYLTFVNSSRKEIEYVWIDTNGEEKSYGRMLPGQSATQSTFSTHVWLIKDASTGEQLGVILPRNSEEQAFLIEILAS